MINSSMKLAGLTLVVAGGCSGSPLPECSDVSGTTCTWAGVKEHSGFNDLPVDGGPHDRTESWLNFPADLTFAPDGRAWIVDWNNHMVRRVEADRTLTTMNGTGYEGDGPGETPADPTYESDRLPLGSPPGAPGNTVALNHPTQIAFAPDGMAVLAAWHDNKIRVMDPVTNIVKVLAGDSYGFAGDGGPAYEAVFNVPKAIAIDPAGQIYVLDQRNERLRVISGDTLDSTITTVAGNGTNGYAGDGGDVSLAEFGWQQGTTPIPSGALALDGTDLYIADGLNNRIRKLDLVTNEITCIAGIGTAGYAGDGGPAASAELNDPLDLEFGPDGRLYVADTENNVVRAIDLGTGIISLVAGDPNATCPNQQNCFEAEEGVDALAVQFAVPYGITFDSTGNLYVADTNNSRIVRIAK